MSKDRITRIVREAHRRLVAMLPEEARVRARIAAVLDTMMSGASSRSMQPDRNSADAEAALQALRQRVAELEEALQARDEFISTVGHELRNPLSPLFLQLQHLISTLESAPDLSVPSAWLLPRLQGFADRLQRFLGILNRILDVSRISEGMVGLELEDVDLAEIAHDMCMSFEHESALARSELRLRADAPVRGRWDRMRLEQICRNLISNAIRYGAGHPIDVVVQGDEKEARLMVRDQGIGIPEEDQVRIFHRLERVATRQYTGGFGIGLWIVRNLCNAMGGSVQVQSRVGQGATFTVILPRDQGEG